MKKTLLAALVILFAAASCKKDDPATPNAELKVGSSWVYKYTDYDETGAVVSTNNITLTITSQQTIGDKTFFALSGAGDVMYVAKGSDGYYTLKNNVPQLQFKIPAAVNDTWRVTYSDAPNDYSDFKVISTNENVSVPMGTISCYYIEGRDGNSLEDKVWYNSTNVIVKQEEYDESSSGSMVVDYSLELVSFNP